MAVVSGHQSVNWSTFSTVSLVGVVESATELCRAMPCKRGLCHHAASVCLSRSSILSKRQNFSLSSNQAILVFPYQMAWEYYDGNPPNAIVKCRWGWQKSWYWAYIWLHCVLSMLRPSRCYQHRAARPCQVVTLTAAMFVAGRRRQQTFMTRCHNVTPKTTEQHLTARSDKSVADVTDNKSLSSTFCTIEANYWHTRSIARPLCDSRATCITRRMTF